MLCKSNCSVLSALEQPLRHLILLNNIHVGTPSTEGVSVHSIEQRLTDGLKELLRPKPLFPQALARPEKLITRRPTDDEVLRKVNAPYTIEPADERRPSLAI